MFAGVFTLIVALQLFYWRYTVENIIYEKSRSIFEEVNYQYANQFEDRLTMSIKNSDSIKNSPVVKNQLHQLRYGAVNYRTGASRITSEVTRLLNTETVNMNLVRGVRIYMTGNDPILCYIRTGSFGESRGQALLEARDPAYFAYVWQVEEGGFVRALTYIADGSEILGLMEVTFGSDLFGGIVDTIDEKMNIRVSIEDPRGRTFFTTATAGGEGEGLSSVLPIYGGQLVVRSVLSESYIGDEVRGFSVLSFGLLSGIILALFLILLMLYTAVMRPFGRLIAAMENMQEGNLSFRLEPGRYREFDIVNRTFNDMARRTQELISTVVKQNRAYSELQVLALGAKFNPHFLYNTLDMIKWELTLAGRPDLTDMIVKFSNLLRYSVSTDTDSDAQLPSIRRDFQNLENYLSVQAARFKGLLQYELTIEEGLGGYPIPKLLVQPLVENCIKHGFGNMQQPGRITVEVCHQGGDIAIAVADDGLGLPDEKLSLLQTALDRQDADSRREKELGLGLYLVCATVRYYYGPGYGVQLEKPAEGGFRAVARIARSPDYSRFGAETPFF